MDGMITRAAAARILACYPQRVTDMIHRGDLEAFTLGPRRTIVVRESDVRALAAEEQTLRPYVPR